MASVAQRVVATFHAMRSPWAERRGPAGRWRLAAAAAASLLLHGALLGWLVLPALAARVPMPQPRQSMEVLWIGAVPAPQRQVAEPTAQGLGGTEPHRSVSQGEGRSQPPPTAQLSPQEWQSHYAGRVIRVETDAGVYCVHWPEAGAAPRIAVVKNC